MGKEDSMAINKERLKEVISNCGIVYAIEYNKVEMYDLSDEDVTLSPNIDYALRVYNCLGNSWFDIKEEDLFETKAEAEEYLEFGNVTRMERLELPTWEEMQDKLKKEEFVEKYYFYSKHFYKANRDIVNIDYTYSIYIMPNGLIIIDDNEKPKTLFSKPLTKENYTLARRLCVKLFRGESV